MKLARKLTAALVCGIVAVIGAYGYFQLRQEVVLSQADLLRAQRIGRAWMGTIEAVWEREGPARAHELAIRAMERAEDVTLHVMKLNEPTAEHERLSADEQRSLLAGDFVRRVYTDDAGDDWRQIFVRLRVNSDEPAIVEYAEPMEAEETFIRMSHLALAVATLAVVTVCGLIVSSLQYVLVGRPLQLLRDKAQRAGAGDFSRPLDLRQRDEMGELARDINAMCDRISAANRKLAEETEARVAAIDQMRHTDRLATVGQLAAGVAHELGTPLNVVSARAELIVAPEARRADVVQNAGVIVEQCDRMTGIIQQLLEFSRRRGATPGLADLRHVVARTLGLLSTAAEKARISLQSTSPDTPVLVRIDQNQMQQAVANIVLNGIQAMPNGGCLRVDVELRRTTPPANPRAADRDYACITVADEGAGIAPGALERIFEPFFTTKRAGEGTGLGLAVAHGIVAEHGGWIAVESTVGTGSRFAIFVPLGEDISARDLGVA
ncbi:MAG TPA: ATP-binding protein [Candidatus Kryptonia bacterium]|nr:ATP-binding protein [Candidatus Kryptonia bacterium]